MCVLLYCISGRGPLSKERNVLPLTISNWSVCAHQYIDGDTSTAQSDTTHKQLHHNFLNKYKMIILRLRYKSEPTIQQYVYKDFK